MTPKNTNSSWNKPTNSNVPSKKAHSNSTRVSSYGRRKREVKDTSNTKIQQKRGKLRWQKNDWDEVTGFSKRSEQNIIAHEILSGGTREEIIERLQGKIVPVTRTGKTKQISSQVSAVMKKLQERKIISSE